MSSAPSRSASQAQLVDCVVCEKQFPTSQFSAHLTTPAHLANLTSHYHTLAREHAQQGQMIQTLRSVLAKADETIQQLLKEKNDSMPIAIFDWSGGASPHLEPFGNAPLRTNSQPPASHMEGNPWPREFYEIVKDKQHITLAPIEFHETFTIMFAMNNYSYREWVRYFDCLTSTKTENGDPSFTDWIEIVGRAPRDKTGLMFVIQRDGYDVEECIVYNEAVDLHRWQHITASIDHAGIMRLYVDGELRSSHQAKFTPKRGIRGQNRMAAKAIDPRASKRDDNMDGAISHIRIYNDACLTGDQVFHEYLKWHSYNQV